MNPSPEACAAQRSAREWSRLIPSHGFPCWFGGSLQNRRFLEGGLGWCADSCFNHHLPLAGVPCQEPWDDAVSPHQDEVVLPFATPRSPASQGSFACDKPVDTTPPHLPGELPGSRASLTHALAPPGSAAYPGSGAGSESHLNVNASEMKPG